MTESEIQKQILSWLEFSGIEAWRQNSGKGKHNMYLAPAGTPDIIGYMPDGRFIGIEVKQPTEQQTDNQVEWMEKAIKAGCVVFVAHSLDEAIREIERGIG